MALREDVRVVLAECERLEADGGVVSYFAHDVAVKLRALVALDTAARIAVETWDEIGQEGEPYVERLRERLLPENAREMTDGGG